jgi:hypothetical protein
MKNLFLLTTAFALVSTVAIAQEYDPKGEPKSVLTDGKGRLTDDQLFERAKDECSAGRQIDWPKLTAEGWAEVRECITKAKEQRILKDPQVAEICGIHSKGMALTECAYNVYKNKNVEKWKLAKAQHDYIELLKKRLAEGDKTGKPTRSYNELREKLKRDLAEHERQVNTNIGSGGSASSGSGSAGSGSAVSGSAAGSGSGSGSLESGLPGSGGRDTSRNAHGHGPKYRNQSDITGIGNGHSGKIGPTNPNDHPRISAPPGFRKPETAPSHSARPAGIEVTSPRPPSSQSTVMDDISSAAKELVKPAPTPNTSTTPADEKRK